MYYDEAISFIRENTNKYGIKDAKFIRSILALLGSPQDKLKFVHAAGTNGKGSTCKIINNILISASLKTGLFISPHLIKMNERITVNNEEISDEDVESLSFDIMKASKECGYIPSEFEFYTIMAMCYFYEKKCDIVVLETGLGGQYDATNCILKSEVSVICKLGLDHTKILGDTIEKITEEKCGIIKENSCVVTGKQEESAEDIIKETVKNKSSKLYFSEYNKIYDRKICDRYQLLSYKNIKGIKFHLNGEYQLYNLAVAIKAIEVLIEKGYKIDDSAIKKGIESSIWHGRFEILSENPVFIADVSHNPQGALVLSKSLKEKYKNKKIIFIIGLLKDKNFEGIMDNIIPLAKDIITVTPESERAYTSFELSDKILSVYGKNSFSEKTIEDGIKKAMKIADKDDVVCAFGSFYFVGDVISYFANK